MTVQQFCEKINFFNELKSENVIFNQLINEVMLDLNMFSLRVLNRIFRDINGIGIITIYDEMFLTNTIIKKKFLHQKELSIKTSSSNVFYLSN